MSFPAAQMAILPKFLVLILVAFSIGFGVAVSPVSTARADPHPWSMVSFSFSYRIEPSPPIIEAALSACDDATCTTNKPLESLTCVEDICRYFRLTNDYPEHQKLVVKFADKTRESNVFRKAEGGVYNYAVTVEKDSLYIAEGFSAIKLIFFIPALIIFTIFAEISVAIVYFRLTEVAGKWWSVFGANLISIPVIWYIFPTYRSVLAVALAEIFVVIFEACLIYLTNRKVEVSLRYAMTLSLLMNLASWGLGFLVGVWWFRGLN
jgi:hypothetical protein